MGKLEIPKIQGKYDTGQLFLHRIFGYRGVILFPWLAQVYDRDIPNAVKAKSAVVPTIQLSENRSAKDNEEIDDDESTQNSANDVKGRTNTFYQVLIDSRDCPFIVSCGINIVYTNFVVCVNFSACSNRGSYISGQSGVKPQSVRYSRSGLCGP